MGNNSFIAETDQFHKIKFKDGLADFIFPGADGWPLSKTSAYPEGTPRLLLSMSSDGHVTFGRDPNPLQPQGFRSSCSRPFSEAFLRGGQITASFPSPLIAIRLGEGSLISAVP